MKGRCYNQSNAAYDRYGGRGITVCQRWLADFRNFLADMGPCPKDFSIDRINTNGNYTPENCRWASNVEQSTNRRNVQLVLHGGVPLSLKAYARTRGIKYDKLRYFMRSRNLDAIAAADQLISSV